MAGEDGETQGMGGLYVLIPRNSSRMGSIDPSSGGFLGALETTDLTLRRDAGLSREVSLCVSVSSLPSLPVSPPPLSVRQDSSVRVGTGVEGCLETIWSTLVHVALGVSLSFCLFLLILPLFE